MTAILRTQNLAAGYGDFQALFGIDFELGEGEAVALIGANGAGKSTFLRALCGLNEVAPGAITFAGTQIGGMKPYLITKLGMALVPEGRKLFRSLSVAENLAIGAASRRPGHWNLARVFELFPVLAEKRALPATLLSGGQQQMVAIGRALMTNPRVLLCDEISLGLAPVAIRSVYDALPGIRGQGVSLIIVEQDVSQILKFADRIYCLRQGRVVLQGRSEALSRDAIRHAYFGALEDQHA